MKVAALYVETNGVYYGLPDVDPWDKQRDARLYAGPYPVVVHPPCARWGSYWYGGPLLHKQGRRTKLGDDVGCFASAFASVKRFGGVLEHPANSRAWLAFGLRAPDRGVGWLSAGDFIGWTCCVEQGHYGHLARKATWLYAVACELPSLRWSNAQGCRSIDDGFHTAEERLEAKARGWKHLKRLSNRLRAATPIPFRDLLLDMARSVYQHREAA